MNKRGKLTLSVIILSIFLITMSSFISAKELKGGADVEEDLDLIYFLPNTNQQTSSSSSSSSGSGDSSVTNVYNTYVTEEIKGEETEEDEPIDEEAEDKKETGNSWLTGGDIGSL